MSSLDELRQALEALPEPAPPEALWTGLRMRRQRQVRRRRAMTAVASCALAVGLGFGLLPPAPRPQPVPVVRAPVEAGVERIERLRAVDRALQAGYDRGATDAELAPMWEARHALLAHDDAPRGHPSHINDI